MNFYSIYDCKFGSGDDTCEVYVCETDSGSYWYCCEGGANWNKTMIRPFEGCDLTADLPNTDCFTLECRGWDHFVETMTRHLEVEMINRAVMTIEIDSINSAFQDDNANDELIRILRDCISKIERNNFDSCKLVDLNGNKVGSFYLNIESEEA